MSTLERFENYWSGGDPVTMNRFLMKTITPMMTIISSYVIFVTIVGPAIMKDRKPIRYKRLMVAYNFSLVLFYLYFLLRGAFFIPVLGFQFICGSLNSYESETHIIPDIFNLGYQLYVVRYVELLDTVFMVLSKKNNVTNLHVFHHAIVPIFGWFGFRSESSGYLAVFMALNSIVHIIMYTYYAIASLGPKYQKYIWWKKYLTSLQILQFLVITFYLNVMYAIGCVTSIFVFSMSTLLNVLFFFLFINYYRHAYKKKNDVSHSENNGNVEKNGVQELNGFHLKAGNHTNGVLSMYKNSLKKTE